MSLFRIWPDSFGNAQTEKRLFTVQMRKHYGGLISGKHDAVFQTREKISALQAQRLVEHGSESWSRKPSLNKGDVARDFYVTSSARKRMGLNYRRKPGLEVGMRRKVADLLNLPARSQLSSEQFADQRENDANLGANADGETKT